ncbi:unnamed protein product [Vitrella brassicaformis CCMP3155]|uniref:Kinesin-like protein n=3 Tax=Vitrella brassicaformis TaxID=1169539 RepID=A0A0G4EI36_VITBC|nr:unnamed protein product [Vitrella brassicaformis CCMP3155]|eukprot:CEL95636.1 unnamed protein product [Vitrella brassicaformis CCMP3155]
MPSKHVRVVVRTRPTGRFAEQTFRIHEDTNAIDVKLPKSDVGGTVNNQVDSFSFKFDRVLHNASQERVFDEFARELLGTGGTGVLDGFNGTCMAYGQTGAGKTFTMVGGPANFAYRGIIPRCITALFTAIAARPECAITVRLGALEIYNELMMDLLPYPSAGDTAADQQIQEDSKGGVSVKGLTRRVALTEEECLQAFFEADAARAVSEHSLNVLSSRSHFVVTLFVESRSRVESNERVVYSKIHLVDLAGSERLKKTGSFGATLKEATFINKSLTFLEQVVVALSDKRRDHVPYRSSKLTHLLKDSIGGNCRTMMIANIWPEGSHVEETVSTLRFATRMMRVSNEATQNIQLDSQQLIRKYEREIRDLKQELAMHDILSGRSQMSYEPYTPEEQREIEKAAEQYFEGEVADVDITSIKQVRELFQSMRRLYQNQQQALQSRPARAHPSQAPGAGAEGDVAEGGQPAAEGAGGADEGVGDEEAAAGLSVGVAADQSKRAKGAGLEGGAIDQEARAAGKRRSPDGVAGEQRGDAQAGPAPPDRQTAFTDFKASTEEGQQLEAAFNQNKIDQRTKKQELRTVAEEISRVKVSMEEVKEMVQKKQRERSAEGAKVGGDSSVSLIDEEEYALIKRLKDLKKQYREQFDAHKELKAHLLQIDHNIQKCKTQLLQAFERWYEEKYGQLVSGADAVASAAKTLSSSTRGPEGDDLDENEQFDMMEASRLETQHPDALAFYNAKRKTSPRRTAGRSPGPSPRRH